MSGAFRVVFDLGDRGRAQLHDVARLLYELEFTANRASYVVTRDGRGAVQSITRSDVDVRQITFGSPLEVVLLSSASVLIVNYLRLLRDWAIDPRIRNAALGEAENELALYRALTLRVMHMIEARGLDEGLLRHLVPQCDGEPIGVRRIAEFASQIKEASLVDESRT